jgi:hypothetical protein
MGELIEALKLMGTAIVFGFIAMVLIALFRYKSQ